MSETVAAKHARPAPSGRLRDAGGRNESTVANLLILPGRLLLLFIVLFPAGVAIYLGFTEWTPTSGTDVWGAHNFWHWFDGYWEALTSSTFWAAMWRTALFTVVAVGIEFLIGSRSSAAAASSPCSSSCR